MLPSGFSWPMSLLLTSKMTPAADKLQMLMVLLKNKQKNALRNKIQMD